jgi:hypothetical protein
LNDEDDLADAILFDPFTPGWSTEHPGAEMTDVVSINYP